MVNSGWVKLYRELIAKSIWQLSSPEQKTVLITVLLLANHEESSWEWKGQKFSCKPGQLITSLESLVRECGIGVSTQNVRTALVRFEKLGFLTNESTKTGRLITIVNWEKYQGDDGKANKATNKDLTKSQQRPNKELTTNKNDKNDKNDKKGIFFSAAHTEKIPPSVSDVEGYCQEKGLSIRVDDFFDYYEARGWKMSGGAMMKDWRAAVRYWAKNKSAGGSTKEKKPINWDFLYEDEKKK